MSIAKHWTGQPASLSSAFVPQRSTRYLDLLVLRLDPDLAPHAPVSGVVSHYATLAQGTLGGDLSLTAPARPPPSRWQKFLGVFGAKRRQCKQEQI